MFNNIIDIGTKINLQELLDRRNGKIRLNPELLELMS